MFITLQKPSLTFRTQQSTPTITIFTNELDVVSRQGLLHHLLRNKKLAYFGVDAGSIEGKAVHLQTARPNPNLLIDRLLEENEDLSKFKVEYPLMIEILITDFMACINSTTMTFRLGENLEIEGKIGEGSFAEIFLARETVSRKLRCIKKINKEQCERKGELTYITNQFEVLTKIECREFVRMYYAFEDDSCVYLVLEMCPYGDLFTYMRERGDTVSLRQKYYWFIQIALAIGRLHHNNMLYRDLKPENILIDCCGNAKLCDFGYACKYDSKELLTEVCGSYEYIPPELVSKQGYHHSFDLYCLGLLFYEILMGENPYHGITPKTLNEIHKRKIRFDSKLVPEEAKELIQELMEKDPTRRLGYENPANLFKHRFFKENREIVVKSIRREGLQPLDLRYRIRNHDPHDYEAPSMVKHVLPVDSFNYLSAEFDLKETFGPTVIPT